MMLLLYKVYCKYNLAHKSRENIIIDIYYNNHSLLYYYCHIQYIMVQYNLICNYHSQHPILPNNYLVYIIQFSRYCNMVSNTPILIKLNLFLWIQFYHNQSICKICYVFKQNTNALLSDIADMYYYEISHLFNTWKA